jgi:hypothetical protein
MAWDAFAVRSHAMLRRTGRVALLGCAIVLTCGLTAAASEITSPSQTDSVPLTPTDWGPGNFSPSVNPLPFAKFDPSLGTLKSINISLSSTFTQDVSMDFSSPAIITVTGDQNQVTLKRPDLSAIINAPVPPYVATQSYSGLMFPHTITMPTNTSNNSVPPVTLTSAADLALFTQSGPGDLLIGLPVTARAHSSFTSSTGNGFGSVATKASATINVSYTYESTPEPSTLLVLGLGTAGLAYAQRRRRSAR